MTKLFVSDLDGTLLKIGNEYSAGVSETNREAITSFVNQGNIFAIASARGIDYVDEIAPILHFRPDFIGQNGTALYYSGKSSTKYIALPLVKALCEFVESADLKCTVTMHGDKQAYIGKRIYYPYNTDNALHDRIFLDRFHKDLPEDISSIHVSSMAVFVEPERLPMVRDTLKQHFAEQLEVVSSDIDLINISPFGCTKGNGIKELMKYYRLDEDDVAVIGDSDNDISMFHAVKHSYCMDHSDAYVQKEAKTIVSSVAEALEHFMKQ